MSIYHTTGNIIQRAAWLPLRMSFKAFLRMECRGLKHVRNLRGNAIFASTHAHELDPLIIVSCLPFFSRHVPLVFVARERSFYAKLGWRGRLYGGLGFKLMGALEAYSGHDSLEDALPHHMGALSRGHNVCIFPMGKKHTGDDVCGAKGGVSYLSAASGVPIVPVRVSGIEHMRGSDFWRRRRKLRVTFGKPLYFHDIAGKEHHAPSRELCEQTAAVLMEKIVRL